jgi:hypothetical protein
MLKKLFQFGLMCGLLVLGLSASAQVSQPTDRGMVGMRARNTVTLLSSENEVIRAIGNSDEERLAKSFDGNVELSLPNKSGNFSKDQAKMVMGEFFDTYTKESFNFEYVRETTTKTGRYFVGVYETAKKTFDVKVTTKLKGSSWYIDSIHVTAR